MAIVWKKYDDMSYTKKTLYVCRQLGKDKDKPEEAVHKLHIDCKKTIIDMGEYI